MTHEQLPPRPGQVDPDPADPDQPAQAEPDLNEITRDEPAGDAPSDGASEPEPDQAAPRTTEPAVEDGQSLLDAGADDADDADDEAVAAADRTAILPRPVPTPGATLTASLPTSWPDPIPVSAPVAEPGRFDGWVVTAPLIVFGALMTIAFLMFVAIEPTPRWLLLFAAVIAVLGTDGVLRQSWPRPFARTADAADSTPYLFLPALAAIAAPMLIEHNVRGYLVLPAALLAGITFTAMISAQVSSVRVAGPAYPIARLVSTATVYFSAFALFSLSYVLDVELPASVAAVGVVAAMLGVELFREGQVDPIETLLFSVVTGVILGEARWAMYYIPVGGYLAGLALLLGFFLVTGLLHSHLTRRLNNTVTLEYTAIAAAGVLLVVIASQAGLG